MIQVGIEPKRLLKEIKQNNTSRVVADMPVYEGMEIFVADAQSKVIEGATNRRQRGKTLDEIGIVTDPDNQMGMFVSSNERKI